MAEPRKNDENGDSGSGGTSGDNKPPVASAPADTAAPIDNMSNAAPVATGTKNSSSEESGQKDSALAKSLPGDEKKQEQQPKITVEEARKQAADAVRDAMHALGIAGEAVTQGMNIAANFAEHARGALDIAKITITSISKATGMPEGVLNAAQEAGKGMQFAAKNIGEASLSTFASLTNVVAQKTAEITPPR